MKGTKVQVERRAVRAAAERGGRRPRGAAPRRLASAAREREERYRAFFNTTSEGIWRMDFDPPIDTSLPVEAQVESAYRDGRLADCNPAMARMYAVASVDDLVGVGLDFMLPASDPAAREFIASIVRAGYRVTDVESVERDADGRTRHFLNTMSGIVEDGLLRRVWGAQRDITERRQIETALRESDARFRLIADAAPVLIWVSGPSGEREWVNRPWLAFVGRSLDAEVGYGWLQNVHPDDLDRCRSTYDASLAGWEPFVLEYRLRRHDGTYRWVLDKGVPRHDGAGVMAGFIGCCVDVTDARRDSEDHAYLAAIVDSSDDAIISKNLDGIIQSCNAAAERIFGYSASELIGQPMRILVPPERRQEEDEILARLRRGERIEHLETVRVTRGGRRVDISMTVSAVRNERGVIVGASNVGRDITDRKRAAEQMLAHQAWLETTLQSIADAVIATDVHGRVAFMNPVAERLTGWRAADAIQRQSAEVFRVISEAGRVAVEDPVRRALWQSSINPYAQQTLLVSTDGTERPIETSAAPIRNQEGQVIGLVIVFRDVTERRRVDVERQAAAIERERLLEAERAARAEAERASHVKDEFVAMVSHELRTPLNAILGWTQLMSRSPHDPAIVERGLDVVARNTRLQAQLVSDLLDVSRIVAGKLQLEVETVRVASIVDEAIETIAQEARAKDVAVRRPGHEVSATVAGDPARLQQIVWNLLSNAVKFTPPGGEIGVDVQATPSHTSIVVTDTGKGVRAEFLPHVFDRFHQADRSITRRFGGLGLGLAIVKHLTELHGGTVTAESRGEGLGSTFTVTLPSSTLPVGIRRDEERAAPIQAEAPLRTLEGVRVLAVEDEPDTLRFLESLLEGQGATVLMATTAHEALDVFREGHPDVLISDIGLPEMDGYELLQQIRAEGDHGRRVAAVALTAYARDEDRARALRSGYQAHVSKPVEVSELLGILGRLLEGENGGSGGNGGNREERSNGGFSMH